MGTVISFRVKDAYDKISENSCKHTQILVDEDLWTIECKSCGAKLDPIAFLVKLAKEERYLEFRIDELRKSVSKLQGRVRTKCIHCGKITPI